MKQIFAVSALTQFWRSGTKSVFAADPYIAHFLEREGLAAQYSVTTASGSRREDFEREQIYVDRKLATYTTLLAERCDKVHGTSYGFEFWRKAFALALLRHVTFCRDVFLVCEEHLDPAKQDCRILDPENYLIPRSFDDHRWYFQHRELGREQLFSVYCTLFHPGKFEFFKPGNASSAIDHADAMHEFQEPKLIDRLRLFLRAPQKAFVKVAHALLARRGVRTALIECSFSPEHFFELELRSLGQIQRRNLPTMPVSSGPADWSRRDQLCADGPGFDRFDRFVFSALRHGMPRLFVEDFKAAFERLDGFFSRMRHLRWIVCEWWIGANWSAMATAVAKLRGIKHLYNEHNYYGHPFAGTNLKYIFPLVDTYVTIGWSNRKIPNLVRGASLFDWTSPDTDYAKKHGILFVSSIPNVNRPEINSSYGESGAQVVPGYLEMNRAFFSALPGKTLSEIYFRAYPRSVAEKCLVWDQNFALRAFVEKFKAIDDSDVPAKKLIAQSRLVVINYLSTSYIEALVMDVPTVILWNRDAYFLLDEYKDFLSGLVEAGICQTDPRRAAAFVESIKDDPEAWWKSDKVRRARADFLDRNFGDPDTMIDHLLNLRAAA